MFLRGVLFIFFMVTASSSLAVTRFSENQLTFSLNVEGQGSFQCSHRKLENNSPTPPPPWWVVQCDDRTFTVDLWMDSFTTKDLSYTLSFLFHVKEGVASSGTKLTQFHSHITNLKFRNKNTPKQMRSSIDVRNGLADLNVDILL